MRHASLFSGIGGPEVAAAMLGWENVFHCEINPFGRKILDYWFPNSKSYEDITKTSFKEWRGKVDVLTGGFPCQPFSYAGQRRGADDDRYLWPHMFRAIDEIRPAWVVAENVAGITTMVEQGEVSAMGGQATLFEEVDNLHRYRLDETFTLERICADLESHGYEVQPVLIPACAVGAPHRRDRVFIVARNILNDSDYVRHTEKRKVQGWKDSESVRVRDAATDTDKCADGRDPGEDARTDGAEGIQERHEIRQPHQPDKVRSEMCRPVADTDNAGNGTQRQGGRERQTVDRGGQEQPLTWTGGLGEGITAADTDSHGHPTQAENQGTEGKRRRNDGQPRQRCEQTQRTDGLHGVPQSAADTNCNGLEHSIHEGADRGISGTQGRGGQDGISQHTELVETTGGRRVAADTEELLFNGCKSGNGCDGVGKPQSEFRGSDSKKDERQPAADTDSRRVQGLNADTGNRNKGNNQEPVTGDGGGGDIAGCGRWDSFPSVSPVHRGNDGIPFDVDGLAIPFSKWRTESLKAYGNAIVPQVMYEIFRAIEITTKSQEQ